LRFVGKDPAAEALWIEAIDQRERPEEERSDLIEDLNDEGVPDEVADVTPADVPVLLARLRLIERLAPRALDDVNAAAFAEAYKDLMNLVVKLRRDAAK
jgi:hypothetical protein